MTDRFINKYIDIKTYGQTDPKNVVASKIYLALENSVDKLIYWAALK